MALPITIFIRTTPLSVRDCPKGSNYSFVLFALDSPPFNNGQRQMRKAFKYKKSGRNYSLTPFPGSAPYPATYLVSDSGDVVLQFSQPGLTYHMGLGLVFACDSNSGKSSLMSADGIWKGFTGTLVPWPFRAYHARDYIHHGDEATH
jgi:hypothetical protein